ncbi:MAG: glucokinase, partial [Acidobacteriaceae bacterium]|nr:glucokinase [Acidobacteriaceae bacterium]
MSRNRELAMILAGDVGATKTALGIFERDGENASQVSARKFFNYEYSSLSAILDEFLADRDGFTSVCFGVAGPVLDGRVSVTNLHWDIDVAALANRFDSARIDLINDVEATAYG